MVNVDSCRRITVLEEGWGCEALGAAGTAGEGRLWNADRTSNAGHGHRYIAGWLLEQLQITDRFALGALKPRGGARS